MAVIVFFANGPGWPFRIAAVLVLLGMGIGWGLYGSGYIQLGPTARSSRSTIRAELQSRAQFGV